VRSDVRRGCGLRRAGAEESSVPLCPVEASKCDLSDLAGGFVARFQRRVPGCCLLDLYLPGRVLSFSCVHDFAVFKVLGYPLCGSSQDFGPQRMPGEHLRRVRSPVRGAVMFVVPGV
jgi:hypothetical protein